MDKLPISVLILSHNSTTLKRCLNAIPVDQVRQIVVLFNGSEKEDVRRAKFPHVEFYKINENLGCVGGRNAISEYARYDWLLFLDDDQIVSPDSIPKLYARARACNLDIVGSEMKTVNHLGVGRSITKITGDPRQYLGGGGLLMRRKVWETLNGLDMLFNPAYCSDADFHWRAIQKGFSWGWHPGHRIKHIEHSTMHTQKTWNHKAVYERSHMMLLSRWHEKISGKKKPMRISVAIVCHNRADWLKLCVDSLLASRHNQLTQIHILNNGSTDSAVGEYLETVRGENVKIYTSEKNLLCAPGRRYLLDEMFASHQCEYLFFLDDDIVMAEGWEDAIYEAFNSGDVDVLQGHLLGPEGTTQSGLSFMFHGGNNIQRNIIPDEKSRDHLDTINYASGGFSVWKADIVKQNYKYLCLFTAGFADHDQALRALRDGVRFKYVRDIKGVHLKSRTCNQTTNSEVKEWRTGMNRAKSVLHFMQMWGLNPGMGLNRIKEIDPIFEERFGVSFRELLEIGFKRTDWVPQL